MRYPWLPYPLAASLLACSMAPAEPASDQSAAAVTAAPGTLTFTASFSESATPLVAGEQAQIAYDPARLPTCRGDLGYGGDGPGWSIDALLRGQRHRLRARRSAWPA